MCYLGGWGCLRGRRPLGTRGLDPYFKRLSIPKIDTPYVFSQGVFVQAFGLGAVWATFLRGIDGVFVMNGVVKVCFLGSV